MVKPGAHIGPYELLTPIGAGGMGEVWKARDTRLDRTVAIKFSQAAFTARFQQEARSIAALNHPNVATFYDVGDNYLVMEYVDSAPIKPPNDTRKLLDIAVQMAVRNGDGTVSYMSPEQARGEAVNACSDQFSFGLVQFELATGKRAFQRPTAAETMAAIIRDDADPLPHDFPGPFRWIVERCLAKDPDNRYVTTRGLLLELRTTREPQGPSARTPFQDVLQLRAEAKDLFGVLEDGAADVGERASARP